MGIESFFTLQTGVPSANTSAGKPVGVGAPNEGGVSFLDFILSRLTENTDEGEAPEDKSALQSDNPLLEKNPKLDIAKIIADNPEIVEQVEDFVAATGLPPEVALAQTLELNKQAFDNALKPLTGGIITAEEVENGSPRLLQALLIDDEAREELLTANLTPEQLTALHKLKENNQLPPEFIQLIEPQTVVQNSTEDSEEQTLDPALQNLLAIFFPPQITQKQNAQNATPLSTPNAQSNIVQTPATPAEILAARLNSLNVGGDATNFNGETPLDIEEYQGNQILDKSAKAIKGGDIGNFEAALKTAQNSPTPTANNALSILQNMTFGEFSTPLNAPFEMNADMLNQYGLNTASNAPSTLGTFTAMVTQSQSAGHAHPATQMVAVQMSKAAGNGENKTLTLQLDPPELGRVKVKMDFGPEKTLKAVLSTDKPETFMMLQRDSSSLERALQEAGLDLGDGGLSFELAEHGFDFEQNNKRGGGHDSGGTGAGDDAASEEEIIESTMNWHVDPESGHMRYSILA